VTDTLISPAYPLYGPVLSFPVYGSPVGQGRVSFLGKGRGAKHSNADTLKPWRKKIAAEAHNQILRARRLGYEFPLTGPIGVHLHFTVPKPLDAPKRRRTFPVTRPDLSHYVRAAEDALSLKDEQIGTRVLGDDSQIVYILSTKAYPGEEQQALDAPGVLIRVYQVGARDA
jgi:Holliday junction resolvase RusA-like endonuclease